RYSLIPGIPTRHRRCAPQIDGDDALHRGSRDVRRRYGARMDGRVAHARPYIGAPGSRARPDCRADHRAAHRRVLLEDLIRPIQPSTIEPPAPQLNTIQYTSPAAALGSHEPDHHIAVGPERNYTCLLPNVPPCPKRSSTITVRGSSSSPWNRVSVTPWGTPCGGLCCRQYRELRSRPSRSIRSSTSSRPLRA